MQIEETTKEFSESFNPVLEKLHTWQTNILAKLPNIIVAFIFLVIFISIARFIRRMINKYLSKQLDSNSALQVITKLSYSIVLLFGFVLALSILGWEKVANNFLAGAGIIGVALGFAFQDIASNFIAGTFMAFKRSFNVGDLIETNGVIAVVVRIDLRTTHLKTLDGYEVVIPNKEMFINKINNYNSYSSRRVILKCGVAYDSDLDLVEKETIAAILNIEEINSSPAPIFRYEEFAESSINYRLTFWVDYLTVADYLDAQHYAIKAIKKRYDELDINIPFPIRTVYMPEQKESNKPDKPVKESTEDISKPKKTSYNDLNQTNNQSEGRI